MTQQRLPVVNGDDGAWGDILNQFLAKEHYDTGVDNATNGGHKKITIRPGTTASGTAPLKFTSGALMAAPEAGAVEFLTDKLYFTQSTGNVRNTIATYDDSSGAAGDIYYRSTAGVFTRLPIGDSNQVLTASGSGLPVWAVPPSRSRLLIDLMFNDAYATSYTELTNDVYGNPSEVGVWENSSKAVKLFTKNIYYTGENISEVVVTNNLTGETLTTYISYSGDDITLTKVYTS